MKTSTKAVLLSLLVFPGAGQLSLKRPLRALVFAAPVLGCLAYILRTAQDLADKIVPQLLSGSMPLDPAALSAQIEQSSGNTFWANVASGVLLVCWVGAAVDAWRLARAPSRAD